MRKSSIKHPAADSELEAQIKVTSLKGFFVELMAHLMPVTLSQHLSGTHLLVVQGKVRQTEARPPLRC